MTREELVQRVGEHVISSFEKWTQNRRGLRVIIPNKIPRPRPLELKFPSLGDWTMRVTAEAPQLVYYHGPLTPPEYLDLPKALKMIEKLEGKK